jgi:putative acetyltransferase
MIIRTEIEKDWQAVYALNRSAFGTESEANLVETLRKRVHPIISLVAEDNKIIVGHILYTPVSLSEYPDIKIMGLAPMGVLPGFQRKGIGSALVRTGLESCKQLGYGAVVVLGHPEYYPRFGFIPSFHFSIGVEYEVPEDVFMIMELQTGYLRGKTGIISYHPAFSDY